MNKSLIENLTEQAIMKVDVIVNDDDPINDELAIMYIPDCFAQEFAKLIVRECINCCDDIAAIQKHYLKYHIDQELGAEHCIEVIKKHFGIKDDE